MTAMAGNAASNTVTRPLVAPTRRPGPRPTPAELTDAAFLAALCLVALYALRSSYSGWAFLTVGISGLIIGLLASYLASRVTRSFLAAVAAAAVGYFLFGPAVLAAGAGLGPAAPTPSAVHTLASAALQCWKQLLTTQPPVTDTETLLTVPFLLCLAASAAGAALARRATTAAAPLIAPIAVLVLALALGTDQTTDWPVTAVLFSAGLLTWIAMRSRRTRRTTTGASARRLRILTALAAVVASAAVAAAAEPLLPGANGYDRSILRDHVTPPLDLADYPSPLVGFHKYTKDANQLWGQKLMTVTGLPAGTPIEIAVLDDYDGWVWGADNSALGDEFKPFDASPQTTATAPAGAVKTVQITIDPAYALAADVDDWLPTAGSVSSVSVAGPDAQAVTSSLWYNSSTGTGIVTNRLQPGDTISLRTTLTEPALPANAEPGGSPALTDGYQPLFAARAAAWDKNADGMTAQLDALATYLRENGAYSDGGPGQSQYLPGHSIGRLTTFLGGQQPVGDDEQYAAAYALLANSLGIPARVVFGATPEAGGVVRGSDIHAWVQVRVATDQWANIPYTQFMPDHSKTPTPLPPQSSQSAATTVVPPPNPVRPPTSNAPPGSHQIVNPPPIHNTSPFLPAWLVRLLEILGLVLSPVLALLLVYGAIRFGKARRRHHRRTRGTPANRFAAGWLDLVDHARDLGAAIPAGTTRQQQARRISGPGIGRLARAADAAVYGPSDPLEQLAEAFWRDVDEARRELRRQAGRRRRLRADFDIRTLLPAGRGSRRGGRSAAGPAAGLVPSAGLGTAAGSAIGIGGTR